MFPYLHCAKKFSNPKPKVMSSKERLLLKVIERLNAVNELLLTVIVDNKSNISPMDISKVGHTGSIMEKVTSNLDKYFAETSVLDEAVESMEYLN